MNRLFHKLAPILIVIVMAGACWLLFRQIQKYQWDNIYDAWQRLPAWKIWAVSGLALLNFVILMGYDYLAVRSIGHPLPVKKIAFGSFVGFAISNTFGALLGGTAVRYRMYTAWGLSTVEVMRLIGIMAITYWLGVFSLGGILFTLDPFEIPPNIGRSLPFKTVQPLGWILLGLTAAYFLIAAIWRKPVRMYGKEIRLPGVRMSTLQVLVAALDFAVGAMCIFVLLPSDLGISYTQFLPIYMLAWVAVVVTHAPGGIGVFDLAIIALTHEPREGGVLVALAIYRILYHLVPAMIALPLFFLHEATIDDSPTNRLVLRMFGENNGNPKDSDETKS